MVSPVLLRSAVDARETAQATRVRSRSIYGLGGILARLIAIFLIPLYTVYLGPVGFGKIETIVALTACS